MLISKDENIKTSSVYIASLVLKLFQSRKAREISIFEISLELKKYDIVEYRHIFFGLAFLYSTGLIDFKEPHVYLLND